ncbi:YqzL family protein [Salipaludibacillus sp. HK11]
MRQLSWHVFSMTGNVESYLLYKELDQDQVDEPSEEEEHQTIQEDDSFV